MQAADILGDVRMSDDGRSNYTGSVTGRGYCRRAHEEDIFARKRERLTKSFRNWHGESQDRWDDERYDRDARGRSRNRRGEGGWYDSKLPPKYVDVDYAHVNDFDQSCVREENDDAKGGRSASKKDEETQTHKSLAFLPE